MRVRVRVRVRRPHSIAMATGLAGSAMSAACSATSSSRRTWGAVGGEW